MIYFFPDAFASYSNLFDHKDAQSLFDRAIAAGMIGKFILVAVDMDTPLGSSWCVNSPATGNWDDFVIEELRPYIDANFKTLPNRESREPRESSWAAIAQSASECGIRMSSVRSTRYIRWEQGQALRSWTLYLTGS